MSPYELAVGLRYTRARKGSARNAFVSFIEDPGNLVNEQLWQVEDDLRSCERAKAFGAVFIDLARQVYRLNDRRAALKRRINETLHSEFIEEKEYSAAVKPRGRPAP